jgi:hypothetical protein
MNFKLKKNTNTFSQKCIKIGANEIIFNVMLKKLKEINPKMDVELTKKALIVNYEFCKSHRTTLNLIITLFELNDYRRVK